ncbi:nicotinamide mononucleotide transporter [Methylobacillus sp. Pita2]|uniref:nicotinamide mononucleotide transporter n=1 Tax=Methylobacillus sp. Pita2 TaxID=3383245 RepID=UPI0038B4D004
MILDTLLTLIASISTPGFWVEIWNSYITTRDFWVQVIILLTGLGGQHLVAKRRVEGFYLWFIGNFAIILAAIPSGMYGMAVLYTIYIGYNLYSIKEWKKATT